jgi:tRNA A-37 threonylcarbamoyl transferase component Bud32
LSTRKTYRVPGRKYNAVFVDSVPREIATTWLERPATFFDDGPGWNDGSPARTTHVSTPIGELFVKEQRRKLYRAVLDALVGRPTAASRAFATGLRLAAAGVRAARPIGVIQRRMRGESFLLLEFVDARHLHQHLVDGLARQSDEAAADSFKRTLWVSLGQAIADLHAAGVRQRDLKAPNILVDDDPSAGPIAVFVDLEGMERLDGVPSRALRQRDLARLAASFRAPEVRGAGVTDDDWRRVLMAYFEARGASEDDAGELDRFFAGTLAWAERKEERNQREGKRVY